MQVARTPENDWVDEFIQEVKKLAMISRLLTPTHPSCWLTALKRNDAEQARTTNAKTRAFVLSLISRAPPGSNPEKVLIPYRDETCSLRTFDRTVLREGVMIGLS
jgi:hypothetical protein